MTVDTSTILSLVPQGAQALSDALGSARLGAIPGLMGKNAYISAEAMRSLPSGAIECIGDHRAPKLFYVSPSGTTSEITKISKQQQEKLGKLYTDIKGLIKKDSADFSINLDQLFATVDGDDVFPEMTPELQTKIQEIRELVGEIYKNTDLHWPTFEPGHRTMRNASRSFAYNDAAFKKPPFSEQDLGEMIQSQKLPPIETQKKYEKYEVAKGIHEFLSTHVTDKLVPADKALEGQSRRTDIAKTRELLESVDQWAVHYALANPLVIPHGTLVDAREKILKDYMEKAGGFLDKAGSIKKEAKKVYLEDLVRLHPLTRAEYKSVSDILKAEHRQDGPELFLVRLSECIVNSGNTDALINSNLSSLVLGPLNEVDRNEIRKSMAEYAKAFSEGLKDAHSHSDIKALSQSILKPVPVSSPQVNSAP